MALPDVSRSLAYNCIQVEVYRDGTHGSPPLPALFAPLLGVNEQHVKATATAQVIAANASGCMRPWFITDKYVDVNGNLAFDSPPIPIRFRATRCLIRSAPR